MALVDCENISWDDLYGYYPAETSHIENLIGNVVKLENGDVFHCDQPVEDLVDVGDFCIVFQQKLSAVVLRAEIEEMKICGARGMSSESISASVDLKERMISLANSKGGIAFWYKLLIGEHVVDADLA
ncbi:hypothetical protein [Falsiroseomonas sp.]|uniref:hypothetical protein n=1 Tax=Falsiroseomonas sp. TaxID=2870721 RepID=UPI0035639A24